jgi:hypothetical protein
MPLLKISNQIKKLIFILGLILILQPVYLFAQAKDEYSGTATTQKAEYPFFDKNLTKGKIKELITHFWPDRKNIIIIRIYKTNCDDDWVIHYSKNIPQYKYTNRKITYIFKKDNICYKVEDLVFYCDYLGGGQYGEIHTGYYTETIKIVNNCIYKS